MLKPHPESKLSLNILVLGSDIIKILTDKAYRDKYIIIETIMDRFLNDDPSRTPDMFIHALTFLYALGIIEQCEYKIKIIKQISIPQQQELF